MCVLLFKPFVLGYILLAALIQLAIFLKWIVLVPRGLDSGLMGLFLLAIFMSQRVLLGGSMLLRILILGLGFLIIYFFSKRFFPDQYRSLIKINSSPALNELLDEEESFNEKKQLFVLKSPQSISRIKEVLRGEKASFFELAMAFVLAGIFVYFLVS